ncbi:hypothetical protein KY345_01310 [Candidatus Woesearchaeota archaeon]|nr:hypothetical protein [Candidatus Woesearchaeota archaeon]
MELDKNEKVLLKHLVKNELEEVEKQEGEIITPEIPLLEIEEKYDIFLKKLLEKLD